MFTFLLTKVANPGNWSFRLLLGITIFADVLLLMVVQFLVRWVCGIIATLMMGGML
jgi:hypothetical protein